MNFVALFCSPNFSYGIDFFCLDYPWCLNLIVSGFIVIVSIQKHTVLKPLNSSRLKKGFALKNITDPWTYCDSWSKESKTRVIFFSIAKFLIPTSLLRIFVKMLLRRFCLKFFSRIFLAQEFLFRNLLSRRFSQIFCRKLLQ